MTDSGLQQEAERAWELAGLRPNQRNNGWLYQAGYLAAADSRDAELKALRQRIRDLTRYATHEFGCPAISAAGDCDCGVEEFWDHA